MNFCYWSNIFDYETINFYKNKIENYYTQILESNVDSMDFDYRTLDITNDKIVYLVKNFIENKLSIKLDIVQAQCQVWPINSESKLHRHCDDPNEVRKITKYNSLIYLNDDYDGGEFYTDEIIYKPKANSLTFFDGSETYHGVKQVKTNHRYTLIFWWK